MNQTYFQNYNIFIFTLILLFFSIIIKNNIILKVIYIISIISLIIFIYKHIQLFHIKKYDNKIPYNIRVYITNYLLIFSSFLLILFIFYHIFF